MPTPQQIILGLVTVVSTHFTILESAHANCAMWGYQDQIDRDTNTVIICADGHVCGEDGTMLRQNLETGEVVELQGVCGEGFDSDCYVDECLPAGAYRYGLATPLQCGCGVREFFSEITLENDPPDECVSSEPNIQPLPYGGDVPWGDEASETCSLGCSVASSSTGLVVPTYTLIFMLGLGLIIRRKLTRR